LVFHDERLVKKSQCIGFRFVASIARLADLNEWVGAGSFTHSLVLGQLRALSP
jgi:hypothetical protein